MALVFPSDQWIKALSHQLNDSASYEQSATDWEGDFVFVVEPDADYQDTAYLFLGLYHGKSPDAALMAAKDERETEFAISAPFGTWRQVIQGTLDPIQSAFVEKGGIQCGFCSPGMILSAKPLLDDNPNANEEEIKDAIAGNLCRCTGYVQIIDSIKAVSGYFKDEEPTVVAWKSEEGDRGE